MEPNSTTSPGLFHLLRRIAGTGVGVLHNRLELFSLELQEERIRIASLLVFSAGLLFAAVTGTLMLTAVILLLVPESARVWVVAVLAVLFWGGAIGFFFALKNALTRASFGETLSQVRKDSEWLESLK